MNIEGYYVTCDEALCYDCYQDYDWPGFEDWTEPLPISYDDEADTPTHCDQCHRLIEHRYTEDGIGYIMEAVIASIQSGSINPLTAVWSLALHDYDISVFDLLTVLPLDPPEKWAGNDRAAAIYQATRRDLQGYGWPVFLTVMGLTLA